MYILKKKSKLVLEMFAKSNILLRNSVNEYVIL